MRSTKTMIGVAAAGACVLALMLAGWATGAQAPVGSGKASATKSVCGLGNGKKATGSADQARRHRHADPGRRLHDDRQGRRRVLRLRQRQRRHPRPPDQVHPLQRAAQPRTAGARSRRSSSRATRSSASSGNTSFTECATNWKYYKSEGLLRDRRGRAGRLLRRRRTSSRRTSGRATRTIAAAQAARPRGSEVARRRLAVDDRGVRRPVSHKVAEAARIPWQERPGRRSR